MNDTVKKINNLLIQKFDLNVNKYSIITYIIRDIYTLVAINNFDIEGAKMFKMK
mgnify:CR=1 FL=1